MVATAKKEFIYSLHKFNTIILFVSIQNVIKFKFQTMMKAKNKNNFFKI